MSEVRISEVQKYLDCGCVLLVGGERVWCPSCLGGGSASKAAPAVIDAKRRIADLERQLAEAKENAFILAHAYTHDSRPPRRVVGACLAYEARKPK